MKNETPAWELVASIRKGDSAAWDTLTRRYTGLLWSIARSLRLGDADAADAVQTTWLRLIENVDNIRDPDRVGSWLATSMRRESYDILRRAARVRVGVPEDDDEWPGRPDEADPLDVTLLRDERDAELWRAMSRLKPHCQRLLRVLVADPAPSYAEAAAALRIPLGSVGPTRQRCLSCLRELLTAGGSIEAHGGE